MKEHKEKKLRPGLREQLYPGGEHASAQKKQRNSDVHQANLTPGPYTKAGLYIAGAFALIWASQFALAALAGMVRQYKNLKRAFKE